MNNITIALTKKEWGILRKHFSQDISYGVGGTFGNGGDFDSTSEFHKAKDILYKIEKGMGIMN